MPEKFNAPILLKLMGVPFKTEEVRAVGNDASVMRLRLYRAP